MHENSEQQNSEQANRIVVGQEWDNRDRRIVGQEWNMTSTE
jgi:hypothetical protein